MIYAPWTPERLTRARDLWNQGWSAGMIARDLGDTTRNAVIGRMHRDRMKELGISKRTRTTIPTVGVKRRTNASANPRKDRRKPMNAIMRPPKVKPEPILLFLVEPTAETAVSLMDLSHRHCRYPVGVATGAGQMFCGADKWAPKSSFCAWHHRMVWRVAA
jgi:GcrA cell cycle regulator